MGKCKYCNTELIQIDKNDKEYACSSCGLCYLKHRSLRTDKVKFVALEWG